MTRRDNMACHLGLPVSTTHTTVGAVVGMALVLHGGPAVQWHSSKAEFPYYGGKSARALLRLTSPPHWQSGPLLPTICAVALVQV